MVDLSYRLAHQDVPEPTSLALVLAGLMGAAGVARQRKPVAA